MHTHPPNPLAPPICTNAISRTLAVNKQPGGVTQLAHHHAYADGECESERDKTTDDKRQSAHDALIFISVLLY